MTDDAEELRKHHLLDDGVVEEPPAPTADLGDPEPDIEPEDDQ